MTEVEVAKQFNYSKVPYICPYYKVSRIHPDNQTVTINTSFQESIFEIPVVAFNLARSILNFDVTFPDVNAKKNFVPADTFPYIRQIQLYTRTDVKLCDLNAVSNYLKIIYPATTKQADLESELDDIHATGKMAQSGSFTGELYMSGVAADANLRYLGTKGGSVALVEYKRIWSGSAVGDQNGAGASPVFHVGFKLKNIKDTIFSIDKDLFFNEIVYLKIIWNQASKVYWSGTAVNAGLANGTDFDITNVALHLQVEQNQAITQQLKNAIASRQFQMNVPWIKYYTQPFPQPVANQNVRIKVNSVDGRRLLKIWHSCFNTTESSNTIYDNSAIDDEAPDKVAGDQKINRFTTYLNTEALQPFEVDTSKFQDYMLLRDKLKGSAVLNSNIYQSNWFWVEQFDSEGPLHEMSDMNYTCGIPIDNELIWDFQSVAGDDAGTGVALNHYTFAVFLKTLNITPEGTFIS